MKTNQIYIYPTDTIWGIGANIYGEEAHQVISRLKDRDEEKPYSILFSSYALLSEYFNFPEKMNENWLENLFRFEVTMLIERSRLKKEIPKWIYGESSYIGIRLQKIEGLPIDEIISTTSLNLKSENPILKMEEAEAFYMKYLPDAKLVKSEREKLSGNASSIIKISFDHNVDFLREGSFRKQIKDYVQLLST